MSKIKFFLIVIAVIFFSVTSSSYAQKKSLPKNDITTTKEKLQKIVYACPMHPEITSSKPGKCKKCGMNLVLPDNKEESSEESQTSGNSSPKQKIQQAQSLLNEAKKELAQDGKYNCCIKDPCDRCALDHQSCSCANDVKSDKAVCPDCYAGWQRGDGIVKGVKASKVKGSSHDHKH